MVGIGRRRLLAEQPFLQVGIGLVQQQLEPVESDRVHVVHLGVGIGPEQEIHLLGAPMPRAVARALASIG